MQNKANLHLAELALTLVRERSYEGTTRIWAGENKANLPAGLVACPAGSVKCEVSSVKSEKIKHPAL